MQVTETDKHLLTCICFFKGYYMFIPIFFFCFQRPMVSNSYMYRIALFKCYQRVTPYTHINIYTDLLKLNDLPNRHERPGSDL